jgi:hypothetical protein
MKFKSALVTEASGSIGGMTASHNRGGYYFRQRSIPTNPNSPQQQAVRTIVAALASAWVNTLTANQRAFWEIYADHVQLPDPLGEPRNVGGLAMYVRTNVPAVQAGLARIDDAPTTYDLGGEFTEPAFGTISAAGGTAEVAYTNTDPWASEDGAALLILLSRGQNTSVNYFKGPYRFAGLVEGDSGTPPTSPLSATAPFPMAVGQRLFGQARVRRADGRLSLPVRFRGTVGA